MHSVFSRGALLAGAAAVALTVSACNGQHAAGVLYYKPLSKSASTPPPPTGAVERNGTLSLAADPGGRLVYTVKTASATAGTVTIAMTNQSAVPHNVAIQAGTNGPVLGATSIITGGHNSITLNLKPGTYTFFCQVPGHREAGMFGTLTVR